MRRLSPAANTLLLLVVVALCALLLLTLERSVVLEMPSLTLPKAPVLSAMATDAQDARSAPTTAAAAAFVMVWRELGRAEHEGPEPKHMRVARLKSLREHYARLVAESGERAGLAMRAVAVEEMSAALALELPDERAHEVLGAFPAMLAREDVTRSGELVAPDFVARTLYKARWNNALDLAPDHAFSQIELRAFYGWQALHAERLPVEQRMRALELYKKAGGPRASEAAGVLLHRSLQPAAAAAAFREAYAQSGNLRLRNAIRFSE